MQAECRRFESVYLHQYTRQVQHRLIDLPSGRFFFCPELPSSFLIPHSSFLIPHFSFLIFHYPFPPPSLENTIRTNSQDYGAEEIFRFCESWRFTKVIPEIIPTLKAIIIFYRLRGSGMGESGNRGNMYIKSLFGCSNSSSFVLRYFTLVNILNRVKFCNFTSCVKGRIVILYAAFSI